LIGAQEPPNVDDQSTDRGELFYVADDFATYPPAYLPVDGTSASVYNATLCSDEDWVALRLDDANLGSAEGISVCAQFDHSAGDIDLYAYSADDPTVPIAESATKHNHELISLPPPVAPGYYYFQIVLDPRDAGKKVFYRLSIFGNSSGLSCE
jgi:hypothetical protein